MSDYISRQEALEIVKRTSGDYATAFCEIKKLPAADVRPVVRGEWEFIRKNVDGNVFKCSVCGRIVVIDGIFFRIERFPFCHCGADMRG